VAEGLHSAAAALAIKRLDTSSSFRKEAYCALKVAIAAIKVSMVVKLNPFDRASREIADASR